MYFKYNLVLRAAGVSGPERMRVDCAKYCQRNQYTTTLHVINSAIVKLKNLTRAGTVYRGISGGVLPPEFWDERVWRDRRPVEEKASLSPSPTPSPSPSKRYGVMGGVEFAFMSTTRDRAVAVDYAGSKAASVLEIRMGMIDRGQGGRLARNTPPSRRSSSRRSRASR